MKYVIILNSFNVESPIILPEWMNHNDVIQPHHKVVSAGFCRFCVETKRFCVETKILSVSCWGRSQTLKIGNRGAEDEKLLLHFNQFSS